MANWSVVDMIGVKNELLCKIFTFVREIVSSHYETRMKVDIKNFHPEIIDPLMFTDCTCVLIHSPLNASTQPLIARIQFTVHGIPNHFVWENRQAM